MGILSGGIFSGLLFYNNNINVAGVTPPIVDQAQCASQAKMRRKWLDIDNLNDLRLNLITTTTNQRFGEYYHQTLPHDHNTSKIISIKII